MRYLLRLLAIAICVTFVVSAAPDSGPVQSTALPRANIVMILADDLDQMLNTIDTMPNLQALLVAQGMTFSHSMVPVPVCCPARASLLTGQLVHNHRIYANVPPIGGFATAYANGLENATVATALHAAGYRTALLGKYLNGYPNADDPTYIPPGWDEWFVPTSDSAYGSYDYTVNDNGTLISYGNTAQDYVTDVLASEAVEWISTTLSLSPTVPLFALVSVYAPHSPANPAPRHQSMFPDAQVPRTPSFNEADMSDKPPHMQGLPLLTETDIQGIDALYRKRLQSMQAVDEVIGQLVATLQAHGQLENTYIVFTSDNGLHMGQHRLLPGKGRGYEEDIRIPLIVRGPGVPAGTIRDDLASFADLAPTFADIAGTVMPTAIDGRSLLPLLQNVALASSWRKAMFIEYYYAPGESPDTAMGGEPPDWPVQLPWGNTFGSTDAVRSPDDVAVLDYSVIRTAFYKFIQPGTTYTRELYDMTADPYELENRIWTADPLFVRRLEAWMGSFRTCSGDGCRDLEIRPAPFGCDVVAGIPEAECEALVAFYNSTGGAGWLQRDGWLVSNTPCAWFGVTCQSGHVVQLHLPANELTGLLPDQLSVLSALQKLTLAGSAAGPTNHLAGGIPPALGSLASLQLLDLSFNQLSGSLPPELATLTNLQTLNVAGNQLNGTLPETLTGLALSTFHFQGNDLCIPNTPAMLAWLGGISNLGSTGVLCQLVLGHMADSRVLTSGTLTYTLSVQNQDVISMATDLLLSDTLPAEVILISTDPPASEQGNVLTWSVGNLIPGNSYVARIVVTAPSTRARLTNKATASGQLGGSTFIQTSFTNDVLPWADFDGDRWVTELDIQMIGWCWRQSIGGICRPEYRVDPDGDTDIVDLMRAAASYDR